LQEYSSDMQNELNNFNELNVVFQAQLQKSIQDAQLDSAEDSQKLQATQKIKRHENWKDNSKTMQA